MAAGKELFLCEDVQHELEIFIENKPIMNQVCDVIFEKTAVT